MKRIGEVGEVRISQNNIILKAKPISSKPRTHDHSLSWLSTGTPVNPEHMITHFPGLTQAACAKPGK
jgi:hypothetical protein